MCTSVIILSLYEISFNNEYPLLKSVPHHCKEVRIILISELATCVASDFLDVRQQSHRPIKLLSNRKKISRHALSQLSDQCYF